MVNRYDIIEKTIECFRKLTKKYNVPIITAKQLPNKNEEVVQYNSNYGLQRIVREKICYKE